MRVALHAEACEQADAGLWRLAEDVTGGTAHAGDQDHLEGRTSFLKKRSKKLLFIGAERYDWHASKYAKVFWFFFSKKNILQNGLSSLSI